MEENTSESITVCLPSNSAQVVRKELEQLEIWDSSRKLSKQGSRVAIPILTCTSKSQLDSFLQRWPEAEITQSPIIPSIKATLKKDGQKLERVLRRILLQHNLSESLLTEIPKKWERHGDLIILPSTAFRSLEWQQIGDELWKCVCIALVCQRIAQHSHVANDGYRSPQVFMLYGDNGDVVHVDNGIKYSFDVTKCMFSSGNISEKLRVASWDCSNQVVVDLYAGIGYFTLPYLVHANASHVHACEWNPDAVAALKNNLVLNGVEHRCTVHQGDNRKLQLCNVADRVNLGLIPTSEDGWCVATRVLKSSGGVLHVHHNVTVQSSKEIGQNVSEKKDNGSSCSIDSSKKCTNSSVPFADNDCDSINVNSKCHRRLHENKSCCRETCMNDVCIPEDERCEGERHCSSSLKVKASNTNKECGHKGRGGKLNQKYFPWAEETRLKFEELLNKQKCDRRWLCEIIHIEKVKSYAPRIDHVVLDLYCKPLEEDLLYVKTES